MILLLRPVLPLPQLSITLFFGELEVHFLGGAEHISALSLMLLLGVLKHLIIVNCLLIIGANHFKNVHSYVLSNLS